MPDDAAFRLVTRSIPANARFTTGSSSHYGQGVAGNWDVNVAQATVAVAARSIDGLGVMVGVGGSGVAPAPPIGGWVGQTGRGDSDRGAGGGRRACVAAGAR